MKTLVEIKEEYAIKLGFEDWTDMLRNTGDWAKDTMVDTVAKEYAIEVAKEALKNASEKGNLLRDGSILTLPETIKSDKNIPEL